MKKLVGPFAKVGGAIFALGVFVIIVSLSYSALGRIFPNRLFDQSAGMLLFDAAAIIWFLTFIGNCKSTGQYVASGLGFILGVLGSLALIGIEVGISSGMLIAADMVKPLTYTFIAAAVGHLLITYGFHAAAPELSARISLGIEQARAQDEGMRQAELAMSRDLPQLGNVISARILEDVYRTLNMPQQIIEARALPVDDSLHVPSNGYPLEEKAPSFFENPREWFRNKFTRSSPTTSDDPNYGQEVVWTEPEGLNGQRVRIYCLHCLREGKPWRTPEPCSHVLNAKGTQISPLSSGYATDVASVSIPGADAGASTVTGPASKPPTEGAEPSKG